MFGYIKRKLEEKRIRKEKELKEIEEYRIKRNERTEELQKQADETVKGLSEKYKPGKEFLYLGKKVWAVKPVAYVNYRLSEEDSILYGVYIKYFTCEDSVRNDYIGGDELFLLKDIQND